MNNTWSKDDVSLLVTLARRRTHAADIAGRLGRSTNAIGKKAQSMGLSLKTGRITEKKSSYVPDSAEVAEVVAPVTAATIDDTVKARAIKPATGGYSKVW